MKFSTRYIPILSLLTLLCACSQSPQSQQAAPISTLSNNQLQQYVKTATKPYVLINFYATYCKPCRSELPELINLHKDPSGEVEVLFVSVDAESLNDSELKKFTAENGIDFASFRYKEDEAMNFIKGVYPDWNGSIPLNLIYAAKDGRLIEKTGLTDRREVEMIIQQDKMMGM